MEPITLIAPLSGRIIPIESVPDPVFAQKLTGDGIAIDPVSNALLAPCDGKITYLHPGCHALTITANGIEIALHIGLDTAPLKGEGFLAHVAAGDWVRAGDTLIEFDPDFVAARAASLISVIFVANSERVAEFHKAAGDIEAGKHVLMELTAVDTAALAAAGIYRPIISEVITIPNHNGLHIRPAAVLSSLARSFQSDVRLRKGDAQANAKSVSGLMGLDIAHQDEVRLSASGPDAYEAINILTPAVINGLGEEGATPIQAPASTILPAIAAPIPHPMVEDPNRISGIMAAPGLAIGHVYQLRPMPLDGAENAGDPLQARRSLDRALDQTKLKLEALQTRLQAESNPGRAALLAAQHELLDDPELLDMAYGAIDRGKSAAFAWQAAAGAQAARLEKLDNELLNARAAELRAVGARVAREINGGEIEARHLPSGSVLIGEDISAVELAQIDRPRVLGCATVFGGPICPPAALARALVMPAVAGIETRALDIPNGTAVIIDGFNATLHINPSAEDVAAASARIEAQEAQRDRALVDAHQAAVTRDGVQLQVTAAVAGVEEARQAMSGGGDGIGLLRTEYLFRGERTAPTEDVQTAAYSSIAMTLAANKKLTIRTLDINSASPLPFLPLAPEQNPALGQRGLRFTLDQPQILRKQCRAALRASVESGRALQLLLPMIATFEQWRIARELIAVEQRKLEIDPLPIGLQIQVPATAVMADQFAREVDFFSIDADDLVQYSLALDHSHPRLAGQTDALNPAVLRLIATVVQGAAAHEKPLAISGAVACDAQAIPILIGLGISELVVAPAAVPMVKFQIRGLTMESCRSLAQQALGLATAGEVRALANSKIKIDV